MSNIVQKFINGKCNKEELNEAITLLRASYQNLNIRPIIYEVWNNENEFESQPKPENLSEILDKIHHRINLVQSEQDESRVSKLLINFSKIAALLIIGVLFGFFINQFKIAEPEYYTSFAPKGSVSQMLLPDNTVVYLNSGSEIKYSVNGIDGQREVFLDGEAWFNVTKNKKKPFVVHTPYYDVKVLGTQINIKAYGSDKEVITTLEEGSAQISSSANFELKENKMLKPGEQLVFNSLKKSVKIRNVNTRLFTSWKENKLVFINMSLKELIILLERKYGVDIKFTDDDILEYHYDGIIKNENILEVLDLLKETLPIQYKIEGQLILIIKK
ncbi:MAG: FecR family protein [Prolixibacteraceae bacterium]|nr:FecR family protein [Prolixibacteraceae bacterium]